MTEAVAQILSQINSLSQQERAELAYAFICSLEPEQEPGASEAWDAELSRRVAEIRNGGAVWDSIAAEAERVPLSEAQKQDLQRRLAACEANPKAGSSWEEVKARLRGRS